MLSSSRLKIHEPLVTGVSPRPTDQRGARKLRNTRGRLPLPRLPGGLTAPSSSLDSNGPSVATSPRSSRPSANWTEKSWSTASLSCGTRAGWTSAPCSNGSTLPMRGPIRTSLLRPASYIVFDLLARDGVDMRPLPYRKRRKKLEKLLGRHTCRTVSS